MSCFAYRIFFLLITSGEQYPCKFCGKAFTSPYNRNRHVKWMHTTSNRLSSHAVTNKPSPTSGPKVAAFVPRFPKTRLISTVACDLCPRLFQYAEDLERHQRLHASGASVACTVCNKVYARYDAERHLALHSRVPYVCTVCGKETLHRWSHVNHMRTHTGERPYECRYCQRNFVSANHRAKHVRSEHRMQWLEDGERPAQIQSLEVNMVIEEEQHDGLEPQIQQQQILENTSQLILPISIESSIVTAKLVSTTPMMHVLDGCQYQSVV